MPKVVTENCMKCGAKVDVLLHAPHESFDGINDSKLLKNPPVFICDQKPNSCHGDFCLKCMMDHNCEDYK